MIIIISQVILWDYNPNPDGWEVARTRNQVPIYICIYISISCVSTFVSMHLSSLELGLASLEPLNFSMQYQSPGVLAGWGKDNCLDWWDGGWNQGIPVSFILTFKPFSGFPSHTSIPAHHNQVPSIPETLLGSSVLWHGMLFASIWYSTFLVLLRPPSTVYPPKMFPLFATTIIFLFTQALCLLSSVSLIIFILNVSRIVEEVRMKNVSYLPF